MWCAGGPARDVGTRSSHTLPAACGSRGGGGAKCRGCLRPCVGDGRKHRLMKRLFVWPVPATRMCRICTEYRAKYQNSHAVDVNWRRVVQKEHESLDET